MSISEKSKPAKTMPVSERGQARRPQRETRPKPKYVCRAKVESGWVNIGAAWALRSGDDGLSIKLTTIPLNWDGRFILLPPLETDDTRIDQPAEV
jgi:hypothetical protein